NGPRGQGRQPNRESRGRHDPHVASSGKARTPDALRWSHRRQLRHAAGGVDGTGGQSRTHGTQAPRRGAAGGGEGGQAAREPSEAEGGAGGGGEGSPGARAPTPTAGGGSGGPGGQAAGRAAGSARG